MADVVLGSVPQDTYDGTDTSHTCVLRFLWSGLYMKMPYTVSSQYRISKNTWPCPACINVYTVHSISFVIKFE